MIERKNEQNKRTKDQILADKNLISKLLFEGVYTQQEITDKINARYKKNKIDIRLSRVQINYDIARLREELKEESLEDMDELRREKIRHLTHIKKLALESFYKSIRQNVRDSEVEGHNAKFGNYFEKRKDKEYIIGDSKFLEIARKCDIDIAKLQGLIEKIPENTKTNTEYQDAIADAVRLAKEEFLNKHG